MECIVADIDILVRTIVEITCCGLQPVLHRKVIGIGNVVSELEQKCMSPSSKNLRHLITGDIGGKRRDNHRVVLPLILERFVSFSAV